MTSAAAGAGAELTRTELAIAISSKWMFCWMYCCQDATSFMAPGSWTTVEDDGEDNSQRTPSHMVFDERCRLEIVRGVGEGVQTKCSVIQF
jgi:hypothetical protein